MRIMENSETSYDKQLNNASTKHTLAGQKLVPSTTSNKIREVSITHKDAQKNAVSSTKAGEDIIAESFNLATQGAKDVERECLQKAAEDPKEHDGKNYIQLENCGFHSIYTEKAQQHDVITGHQQPEFIMTDQPFVSHAQFWPQDARMAPDERFIAAEAAPAYIQSQGVLVKARPLPMHAMRPNPNEQIFQNPNNGSLGYLRCVDQNMFARPLEMRPFDPSQPILIEDHEALGDEENDADENGANEGTSSKQKGGKRKKKPKQPKIKRPMNAFMVWAKKSRPMLAKKFPGMTNADISIRLGEKWSSMNTEEKQPFFDEADKIKRQHREEHPDWSYQPKPKKHKFGPAGKSFFFEVTKNTQGGYVTRHINDSVLQLMPAHGGKPGPKQVPMIAGNPPNYHYVQGPLVQSHDPPNSANAYAPANSPQPGVYLGSVKIPRNVLASGGVLVAQSAPMPTFQGQGPVAMTTMARQPANFPCVISDGCSAPQPGVTPQ